ncbi:vascular endothelial growth factor C-like [Alosa pseudoharengus]|uniref:vascular endothelial growth factor C-like n=1 Tax=Alosa pseudoharengus TaxID=34774 RepID=UPI003F8C7317
MWMLVLFLRILSITCVCGYEYEDYYPGKEETEVTTVEDLTLGVSSLDELLEVLYPAYRLRQRCLQRRSERTASPQYADEDMWRTPRQLALFKDDGTFDVILEEIQRTICRPREVCLEVSKEFPDSTSRFYLPRCVGVHRCGGCCPSEAFHCTNTSYTLVNKTLLELSPPRMERTVVMVSVVNHTSCECLAKRPRHSIIRRSLDEQPTLCPQPEEACRAGFVWDELGCKCVPADLLSLSEQELEPGDSALLELCGPNKLLDEESCDCVCQNGLTAASCGPGWRLDEDTCECECEVPAGPETPSCPPNRRWDPEQCGCVCQNGLTAASCGPGWRLDEDTCECEVPPGTEAPSCPPNRRWDPECGSLCQVQCPASQPLDPETCLCQCKKSEQTCMLLGKKFKADNCSCYRLPCKDPHRKCPSGSYYSHLVCQCIPNFLRSNERELT